MEFASYLPQNVGLLNKYLYLYLCYTIFGKQCLSMHKIKQFLCKKKHTDVKLSLGQIKITFTMDHQKINNST